METKTENPRGPIGKILAAETELADARHEIVERGWVNSYGELSPQFIRNLDDLLIAVRDAVRHAEKKDDAPLLWRLSPTLDAATRLILARRAIETDRVNHPAAKLNRMVVLLDQLNAAIHALENPVRPPHIQSPREMMAEGCGLPAVMGVWKHLGIIAVENICRGLADDVSGAEHPEYKAWHVKQNTMPNFDDSILHGECRTIDRNRERGNVPAIL